MTKVLVTGGRDYADQSRVDEALDTVHADSPITVIIHGAATGADTLAADWARRHGIPTDPHPARWDDFSEPCVNRNQRMLAALGTAGLCVALPGGRGTADMVARALKAGVSVLEVDR